MKSLLFGLAFLGFAGSATLADVSKDDVKELLRIGTPEPQIRSYVEAHRPVLPLSADDLRDLRAAGASDDLLVFLITPAAPPTVPPVTQSYPYSYDDYYSSPYDSYYPYYSYPYYYYPYPWYGSFSFVVPFHSHHGFHDGVHHDFNHGPVHPPIHGPHPVGHPPMPPPSQGHPGGGVPAPHGAGGGGHR